MSDQQELMDALYGLRDLAVQVREEDFGKEDLPRVKAELAGRLRARGLRVTWLLTDGQEACTEACTPHLGPRTGH